MDENTILLVDEDGNEQEFEVSATFKIEDDEYAVLFSVDDEEDEAYILKIEYTDDGELVLVNIEDKDEFDNAVAAYEAIADEIL